MGGWDPLGRLQLWGSVCLDAAEHGADEAYAVFDAFKERRFTDFADVRAQIERLTDEVAGQTALLFASFDSE